MLADSPGEDQAAEFVGCWRTPRDYFQFVFVDADRIGILQQQSARNVLDDGARRRGADFDEAEIFLGCEAVFGVGGEGWSGDGFDKELGDFLGGLTIYFAIDADDSTKGRDGIAG